MGAPRENIGNRKEINTRPKGKNNAFSFREQTKKEKKMVRYTETEKWNNAWFRSLPSKYKLLWLHLNDSCSLIGAFELDIPLYNFLLGEEILEKEFHDYFGHKLFVKHIDGMTIYVIKGFLKSQRNLNNAIMRKAINAQLERYSLTHDFQAGKLS